ncbi:MAG TPA: carbamate kinase [Nitriliruptoraceae bacterium]|nr:carbamate kinase [Nitriliruptoraceae bacterium]
MTELAVVALGGNAISPAGGTGTATEQTRNLRASMTQLADAIAGGVNLVITHGNGPQVGAILLKNELARDHVPPVPLDWCVANTQATIGFVAATALTRQLQMRGINRPVVPLISRVRVDAHDPAFRAPSKPVGPWLTAAEAAEREARTGHPHAEQGARGWRRVVASPLPRESLDLSAIRLLIDDGAIVITNGGGGIPMVASPDDGLEGVEAVIDKDLAAAMLASELEADSLVILTDVPGVAVDFGSPEQRWLEEVSVTQLRRHAADGQFRAGSMGPKVEAAIRFVEATGGRSVIASLDDAAAAVAGRVGTRILRPELPSVGSAAPEPVDRDG